MKFRVYDNEQGRYIPNDDLCDFYINGNSKLLEWDYEHDDLLHCNEAYPDRYTVEQFTGFCDKNGREIYEGDRVSLGDEHYSHAVIKHKRGAWLMYRNGVNMGSLFYNYLSIEVTGTVHDDLPA